jgi:lipopolysaccharide/colanic/teichoic acid biosynthesis glycosyltransferase
MSGRISTRIPAVHPINMQTTEASPEKSTVDLSGRRTHASSEPVRLADPDLQSERLDKRLPTDEGDSIDAVQTLETFFGAASERGDIPIWKRVLDVSCIVLTLPLWLPIFLLIALWIKIASPGPIFFRQERIGYLGKPFTILKFRTMKVNVETRVHERHLEQLIQSNVPMTKLDNSGDPRIIAGGRILRATGLDEAAQLINVLRGEMSLVGPRPCTRYEFERYQPWQKQRVNALPGLTGYWQVNGKNRTTFNEMVNLDIYYTKNLSLWLDLKIFARTLPAIIVQVIESRAAARMRPRPARATRTVDAA